jgi:hypothetical protein
MNGSSGGLKKTAYEESRGEEQFHSKAAKATKTDIFTEGNQGNAGP